VPEKSNKKRYLIELALIFNDSLVVYNRI